MPLPLPPPNDPVPGGVRRRPSPPAAEGPKTPPRERPDGPPMAPRRPRRKAPTQEELEARFNPPREEIPKRRAPRLDDEIRPKRLARRPNRPIEDERDREEPLEAGWKVDPKTGKKYKTIPKTEWDPDNPGFSKVHLTEVDALYDMNSAANDYLAHLRVPPDKEEMKRLREEKRKQEKAQRAFTDELAKKEQEQEALQIEKAGGVMDYGE